MMLLAAVALCGAIHILAIAGACVASGVVVRGITFGFGPTVLQLGIFKLAALPLGGQVRFMDSREEPVSAQDKQYALDGKSPAVQMFVTLSGCTVLVGVACAVLGQEGLQVFYQFPGRFVTGAVSPFGKAQDLLAQTASYLNATSFLPLLGATAASVAALNLLPLPMMNGGAAIAIVARQLGLSKAWPPAATRALHWVYICLVAAWLIAWLTPNR